MKTIPLFVVILAWVCTSSCSSTPLPQTRDEFFKPLDRKSQTRKPLPDAPVKIEATRKEVKRLQEPSDSHATVDSLENENRMQVWLGRMQHYAPQVKRQVQAKEAMETLNVIKHDRSGVRAPLELDSVEGPLTRKSKATPLSVVRPYNRVYTVQIGAFSKGESRNTFRLQKTAQERFADQVVLTNYDPVDNLYRVSVGEFETRESASRLRKELMRKFPMEYLRCWVNHIVK